MQEYVVTLKSYDDLDNFYDDMETPGGSITIPNRRVECSCRRTISRNTHYMLTEEEAEQVRQDERVLAVELVPSLLGIAPGINWVQSGNFEKSPTIDTNDKNWGLYRVVNNHVSNWGSNGSFTQYTGIVTTTSSGKNVDVVIVDAHINVNHPEFAVNPDGTGGSRVNQLNWFDYNFPLGFGATATYSYSVVTSNHGTHVAGTAAGNTQGWARDANIYNIDFNKNGVTGSPADFELRIFDYIRYFHKNKPINPETGRRNPTITNNSWGYMYVDSAGTSFFIPLSGITTAVYRGASTTLTGLTDAQKASQLETLGVPVPYAAYGYLYGIPYRYAGIDADVADAINDGVIVVASAMNSRWEIATSSASVDWNNYLQGSNGAVYVHQRGGSPGAARISDTTKAICVGSVGVDTNQYKSDFSNYGPRVDVWAPGSNIVSAVYDTSAASEWTITLTNDPRNSAYKLGSVSGTSMAGPQVAGILACYAEQAPNLKQSEAIQYLINTCGVDELGTTGGSYGDYTSLGTSSNNRYLKYKFERPLDGVIYNTRGTHKNRPTSGSVYPRVRMR